VVGDEPAGDVTHAERRELDALRRRAYGPDADILDDALALSRLRELEELSRHRQFAVQLSAVSSANGPVAPELPAPESYAFPGAGTAQTTSVSGRGRPRRIWLIAATALAAVLLAGTAWSEILRQPAEEPVVAPVEPAAAGDERSAVDHRAHLDDLRDAVLSLPGGEEVANRLIRDRLRPHGILYGRAVASGPTVDHAFCMIIADLPRASITCAAADNPDGKPVSVALPAWYSDAESDVFTGLGELVSYTMMPGGSVVAMPADLLHSAGMDAETDSPRAE
jgi:hypothetical protein